MPEDANERARLTPYELVFGTEEAFEEERFPAIRAEAEARDLAPDSPERFLLLGAAGTLLDDLLPEDAPPEAVDEHGALLFHGYEFWRSGKRLFLLEAPLARRLVERGADAGAGGPEPLRPPAPAGYLQLPGHLFWGQVGEEAQPEPVDGFFWVMLGEEEPDEPPYGRVDALLALGLRPGRPGFSVVHVGRALAGESPGGWAAMDARPEGEDFANVLPGGERDELHALTTPGEVLKLLSRFFTYTARHPRAVGAAEHAEPPAESRDERSPHALPPSALPHRRIQWIEDEADDDG